MNWHPTFKCFVDSGLAQNALEIQPHPKEVADLDDEQIKKVKDRFKEQPKKYDLDKMAKKIADLEQNLKAVKLKETPEQYRKLQDELEKLRRQYQSVYKNEPKKTNENNFEKNLVLYAYELGYRETVAAIKEDRTQKAPVQHSELMKIVDNPDLDEKMPLALMKSYLKGQTEARIKWGKILMKTMF